ncbi:ANR family transcriptional regulator [Budvicia aquatica]|uniref:ANR family transcriptional regulator n=1 Tax=Budvicia aquatica TaxID=82979 RepID=UPI0035A2240C
MAQVAAQKERVGDWGEACMCWERAANAARLSENLNWACSRAQFCRHKAEVFKGYSGRLLSSSGLNIFAMGTLVE